MSDKSWTTVCSKNDLVNNSGVCALLNEQQIAIFHIDREPEQVFAVTNYDPIGKANVLYRGIVGSIGEEPVVASPLYKQHFSLRSGKCLQDETAHVGVFPARLDGEQVQLLV